MRKFPFRRRTCFGRMWNKVVSFPLVTTFDILPDAKVLRQTTQKKVNDKLEKPLPFYIETLHLLRNDLRITTNKYI